ncbi:hypothetical protein [Bradyrhizobium sp. URHD0069]|uniref:hypothetical protein n=1 Tax=Bradyrhizobium sp. URHD0069 TaxID=1380355 RepID=UPI000496C1E3|nr:hypothetical protein [Bradyrhizobium sp. URHD0069]
MPYPPIYDISYSYSVFQQSQGNNAFPGTQIDADLLGLEDSIRNVSTFVQGVMRSDGKLQNGIVTYDSLSPVLKTAGLAPADAWATGHDYLVGNSVVINSNLYRGLVAHTSGVFADDLAAAKWVFVAALLAGADGTNGTNGVAAWTAPAAWLTATAYVAGPPASVVVQGGETYVCLVPHVSGTFATDLAAGKWVKVAQKGADGVFVAAPQGRLTLTSGVAITTADVTGVTSIYFTPVAGGAMPIWNGTAFVPTSFSELTLALDSTNTDTGYHQSGKNFDLWIASDSGTVRLGTGPAWSSDTDRGTGAGTTELDFSKSAIPTNKNTLTLRFGSATGNTISVPANQATYVGSFRATANGQATDSKAKRLLFNAYNQASRILRVADPNLTWTYSTATWRQVNGSTSNQIDVLLGLGGIGVSLQSLSFCSSSTATIRNVRSGIGLDSTSGIASFDATGGAGGVSNASALILNSFYNGYPGLGKHSLTWLEMGGGADTQTWFGTDTTAANFTSGLTGSMLA